MPRPRPAKLALLTRIDELEQSIITKQDRINQLQFELAQTRNSRDEAWAKCDALMQVIEKAIAAATERR